jgi:hypothetical protein
MRTPSMSKRMPRVVIVMAILLIDDGTQRYDAG